MAEIRSYRDLLVWQRAVELAVKVYKLTGEFPQSELYGLTGQMQRAVVSIASNIAEGHGKPTREYFRYLSHARGSLAELETQLEIACRIGYLPHENYDRLTEDLTIIGKQLNTLMTRLKAKD